MTIIANDLVPVEPITVDTLLVAIGQRYDILITATEKKGNYWFRAVTENSCVTVANNAGRAIFNYEGTKIANPTSSPYPDPGTCTEPSPLRPWNPQTVPNDTFIADVDSLMIAFSSVTVPGLNQSIINWTFNNTGIDIDWSDPTLKYVVEHDTNFTQDLSVIELPGSDQWTFWVIQAEDAAGPSSAPIPHPLHLHGHDFFILGQQESSVFEF